MLHAHNDNDKNGSTIMSREQPRTISYATLYEEWLLKNSKAKERLKRDEIDEEHAHEFLSAALAGRIGLGASLQCALMNGTHDIEALTELWNQTLWEADEDAASQATALLSLLKPSNDNKGQAMKNAADNVEDIESANIDAFFDDYPECARQDWEDSDSDESDDEEEEVQPQSKKIMATLRAPTSERSARPSPQHPLDLEVVVEKVQPSQAESQFSYTEPAPMGAPQNPYAQQQPNFQAVPPPPPMHSSSNDSSSSRLPVRGTIHGNKTTTTTMPRGMTFVVNKILFKLLASLLRLVGITIIPNNKETTIAP